MANAAKPWKKSIFTQLILTFLAVMLPIFIIGFNIYNWGTTSIKQEISSSMETQVSLYLDNLEAEIQRMQMLQVDYLGDQDLNMLTDAYEIISKYEHDQIVLRIQQRLTAIKSSSRYINEASVHIVSINKTITTTQFRDMESSTPEMIRRYLKSDSKVIYYQDGRILVNAMAISKYKDTGIPRIFFEIELSREELDKTLDSLNVNDGSGSFIFETSSGYLNTGNSDLNTISSLINHIEGSDKRLSDHSSLTVSVGKNKYFVVLAFSDYLKLTLARYIPEQVLFSRINLYHEWFWIFSILSLFVIILFAYYTNSFIHKPLSNLAKAFAKIKTGDLKFNIKHKHDDEFRYIYEQFNGMTEQLDTLIDQVYKQKILVQKAELKQLQSQINPHFLFNSFFILSRRVRYGDSEEAAVFCQQLGEYFQFITRNAADEVPLIKEVEHARIYADIQAARFSNRIKVDFQDLPEELYNILVPRLILQPIIENAFEHGLEDKEKDGVLVVRFGKLNSQLHICVFDNGEIMTEEMLDNIRTKLIDTENNIETTGIINIHRRIKLLFGGKSGIHIAMGDTGGTKVTIIIELGEEKSDVQPVNC